MSDFGTKGSVCTTKAYWSVRRKNTIKGEEISQTCYGKFGCLTGWYQVMNSFVRVPTKIDRTDSGEAIVYNRRMEGIRGVCR